MYKTLGSIPSPTIKGKRGGKKKKKKILIKSALLKGISRCVTKINSIYNLLNFQLLKYFLMYQSVLINSEMDLMQDHKYVRIYKTGL